MLYLALAAKLCSTIFFFGAWMSYIPPKHIQQNEGRDQIVNGNVGAAHEIIAYNNNRSEITNAHS